MDQTPRPIITPKIFIIGGVIVILLSIGLNFIYGNYIQPRLESSTTVTGDDEEPTGESVEVEQNEFTFTDDDQKFSIDYPKGITLRELQKKYYKISKRQFEGRTELTPNKRTNDPEFFKFTINTQRIYRDDTDLTEQLSHVMTVYRFCPKGDYKKQKHQTISLNNSVYLYTPNVRGCNAPYSTYYETFTRAGTFIVEVQSNQPIEKIQRYTNPLLNTVYFNNDF